MNKNNPYSTGSAKNNLKFEFFDVTADAGFLAYGSTLEESFENAALAMFEVMTDTSLIKPTFKKEFSIESEDLVSLLYDYLEELLFLHDVDFMIFSQFKVNIWPSEEGYSLKGEVMGEEINHNVHERRDEVKAVTFHQMEVKKEKGYRVRVILDL